MVRRAGMTDNQLVRFASEFREGILDGGGSSFCCWMVCAPLSGLLRCYGVETETVEGDLGECNHFWLKLPDGRVLDPTADQFNYARAQPLPPVYLGPPLDIHPTAES